LFTWGSDFNGQLGLGHSSHIGDGGSEMGEYLQAVNVGSGRSVVQFQGGGQHSCVILDNFNVKCFGRNDEGQLGYGDSSNRGDSANEMGNYLLEVNLGSGLTAQSLHLGRYHSCVILNGNSFKCFGENSSGQLGIGSTDNQGNQPNEMGDYLKPINLGTGVEIQECFDYSPTSSPTFSPSIYLTPSCSSRFTFNEYNCILTSSSQLKCWGNGVNGQLGYGDTSSRGNSANQMSDYLPFVNVNSNVQSIQVGGFHNCVHLSPSFDVKCWGFNGSGRLGYGDTQNRGDGANEMGSYLPTINFGPGVFVSEVSSGYFHNFILTDSGQIKAWGYNLNGQLGYGDNQDRGHSANQMGNYLPFIQLGSGRTTISSRNQQFSICAILDDLSVKCWGRNDVGQCGQGSTLNIGDDPNEMSDYLPPINFPSGVVVSSLGTGWDHIGIISSPGSLFTWGRNANGQLGLGHSSHIGDSGSEMGEYLQSVNVGSGRNVVQFQGGDIHSCVILDNFNVKCFGNGGSGRLGYGDTSTRGDSANQMGDYLLEVNLGSGLSAQSLHIGEDHTCVVLNDNSFKCFGENNNGQLGIGSILDQGDGPNEMGTYLKPINLGTGVEIQLCFDYSPTSSPTLFPSISLRPTFSPSIYIPKDCSSRFTFRDHNCILTSSSQLKCWGSGADGRLGYGGTSNRGDSANQMSDYLPFVNVNSNVQSIHAGETHNCVHLSPSFDVKCWGRNNFGQLGYGDNQNRGDGANEMGEYLPTINFGPGVFVSEISSGGNHNLIITDSGQIKAWGYNDDGQLGYGDNQDRGDSANEMSDYLPFVQLGSGRTAIISRNQYYVSCVILDDLSVKCWGDNFYAQLGQGTSSDIGDAPNEMSDYLPPINFPSGVVVSSLGTGWFHAGIISSTGSLFTWGRNANGQLGLGHSSNIGDGGSEMGEYLEAVNVGSGRNVVQFQGGGEHSCVILDNFSVKCFGWNNEGQLGYGDTLTRGDSANQMSDYLLEVNLGSGLTAQSLHTGNIHSCVVMNDNSFKCFGDNFDGQLGIGSTDDKGDGSNEMGDYLEPINLGTGVEIQLCFDYSPTSSPSSSPSFQPTYYPTITFSPSMAPSIYLTPPCSSKFSFGDHTCVLTSVKQVKCFGEGQFGRLGYGDDVNRGDSVNQMSGYLPFVNIVEEIGILHVGGAHNCILIATQNVKCWGRGNAGRLGSGTPSSTGDNGGEMGTYLNIVNLGTNVVAASISLGDAHCGILAKDSGQIKAWGRGAFGRLGYGDTDDRGDAANQMSDYLPFVQLGSSTKVESISLQFSSSCALLQDSHDMKCWGQGTSGQLGQGSSLAIGNDPNEMSDYLPPINFPSGVVVSSFGTGWSHSGIISSTGSLFMWGWNSNGQLGIGSTVTKGDSGSEMGDNLQETIVGSGRSVVQFQGGEQFSCVIIDNYELKCFGKNDQGQLGYGHTNDTGDDPNEMGDYLFAVDLGSGFNSLSVHCGGSHTCVVLNDNSFKCWGKNEFGNLGQENTQNLGDEPSETGDYIPSVNLGLGVEVSHCFDFSPTFSPSISFNPTIYNPPTCSSKFAFQETVCALFSDQTLKCWGRNDQGQLGYGDNLDRGDDANEVGSYLPLVNINQFVLSIQVSAYHVCTLLTSFETKCFGFGGDGRMGTGSSSSLGDNSNEMGDYLLPINAGSNIILKAVSVAETHSLILTDDNRLKSWGGNAFGQLGLEDVNNRGDSSGEMGDYLPFIDIGFGLEIQSFNGAFYSSCVITDSGVKCWGYNIYGQLGQGHIFNLGDGSNEMGDYLRFIPFPSGVIPIFIGSGNFHNGIISSTGQLFMWGWGSKGELGVGNNYNLGNDPLEMGDYLLSTNVGSGRSTLEVKGGDGHSCVLLDNYEVKCFGNAANGQIGYGDSNNRGNAPGEMGNYLPYVNLGVGLNALSIHLGALHSCAVLNTNQMICWGDNNYGQLGQENNDDIGNNPNEMGPYLSPINLGDGIEIQICFDYSPSLSPSKTFEPSYHPTSLPTLTPSFSLSPSLNPSTFSPTITYSPTVSPTLGVESQGGIQVWFLEL